MPSWLNNLTQNHPIFNLPPLNESNSIPTNSTSTTTTNSNFSSTKLFPSSTSSPASKSFLSGSKSLNSNANQSSTRSQQNSSIKEESNSGKSRRKERTVLVRGVDLIVAVGKELRIASLVDVKGRAEGKNSDEEDEEDGAEDNLELGEYKTLNTPVIDFEIRQLVLNATSKLLAVVGLHSIAVVVLPRKGWTNTLGSVVECRSLLIGKFYHSLPASPEVAEINWHPWGANSSSLLVLTTDSTFREYSIGEDAEEPSQTLSFVKQVESSSNGKRGFSSDDIDAGIAVSFCLGSGESDWGPLTVYGLMRNGDVIAVCPFLPKKASIPASYIHSLSCFVSAKVDYLRTTSTETFSPDESNSLTPFRPNQSSLFTPSKLFSQSTPNSRLGSPKSQSISQPNALSKRYNHQLRYVNSLVRQVPTSSTSTPSMLSPLPDTTLDSDNPIPSSDSNQFVSITTPNSNILPSLQGPFLLQPPPAELNNGAESLACDIIYINDKSTSQSGKLNSMNENDGDESESKAGLGVIAIAYSDGKVEICLEVEKVEAKWINENEEFEDQEEEFSSGPLLAVFETIDLGLSNELGNKVELGLDGNYPTFVKDPLYPDTIYIYHSLGAHCLSFSRWLKAITDLSSIDSSDGLGSEEEEEVKLQKKMERELRAMDGSDVVWILKTLNVSTNSNSIDSILPVVGLVMIQDIYLGYSILLVTSELQAVGIELSLRVDLNLLPSNEPNSLSIIPTPSTSTSKGVLPETPAYLSLLDSPFTIPTILSNPTGVASVARRVLQKSNSSTAPLIITPETLRFMGTTVETFRHAIRDLVSAADLVQCRLELQMKELSRQLDKLKNLKSLSEDLKKSTSTSSSSSSTSNLSNTIGKGLTISSRLSRVESDQIKLLERTDRILQRLMESHEPVLSSFEKKWFEELNRVEREVFGSNSNGGGKAGANVNELSLESRAKRVMAQLESLKPALEAIKAKEDEKEKLGEKKGAGLSKVGGLGGNQMRDLQINLANESKLILEARQKLDRLTNLLASSSLI